MSYHFNLTPDGGRLLTLPWPWLSWVHHQTIVAFGIYSLLHRLLNALCRPLFRRFQRVHGNAPGVGNAFDNVRLHAVSAGARRVSYVVRLVRSGAGVRVSQASLRRSDRRSDAGARLSRLLWPRVLHKTDGVPAEAIPWEELQDTE